MKSGSQKELERNFIDDELAEAFGYGDEQLSDELDRAVIAAMEEGQRAPDGELLRIMNRLEDYSGRGSRRKVTRVRRVIKTLVAVAVLGAMVIGGSMWVGAKRYYVQEIRERDNLENAMVINNESNNVNSDNTLNKDKVYARIESKLDMEVMELSYLPDNMIICDVTITKKRSVIELNDGERDIFLVQGLNDKPSSFGYVSDAKKYQEVYNPFFNQSFPIYEESLENGEIEFGIRIVQDNVYYLVYGTISLDEFKQVVYGMKPYRNYSLED